MKHMAVTPVALVLLLLTGAALVAYALDAPHNDPNSVFCGKCHTPYGSPTPWSGQSLTQDVTQMNALCTSCHFEGSPTVINSTYADIQTHSSYQTGTTAVYMIECRVCHNPHYQQMIRANAADGTSSLQTGTASAVTTTTLTDSRQNWTINTFVDYVLIPNTAYPTYMYRIIGNTADTLTVEGSMFPAPYNGAGKTYAVKYGKLLNNAVMTPNSGVQPAKLFRESGPNSFATSSTAIDGVCQACHTRTASFNRSGVLEGPGHPGDAAGRNCAACHIHREGFKQSDRCLDCHSIAFRGRAAISPKLMGNSHHIQGGGLDNSHCYPCHWEANSDGSINATHHGGWIDPGSPVDLVIYGAGTRPGTYTPGGTAVQYVSDGTRAEMQKLNDHCLGCHSDQNNNTQPFGDGKTPRQYAWDGTSIAARYTQAGTTPWGKYSGANVTPKNAVIKAYSAHGNAVNNQGGWDLNETWPDKRGGSVNVLCFDCHNSHGSTIEGVTTAYSSATMNGGLLKDTSAGQGGYAATYRPRAGGDAAAKNVRSPGASLCMDCHLTQSAGEATPWGYDSTFGAVQQILGYWDTPYFAPGNAGPQQRYAYKAQNVRAGGHFGASSALSTAPLGNINGLCTPCHDPHGVSPTLGANQQYSLPMLKGTWLTSPYKEDAAPAANAVQTALNGLSTYNIDQNTFSGNIRDAVAGITQSDAQFAGLCLGCHPKNSLTDGVNGGSWKSKDRIHESVKGWGANVKHKYACSKCHSPHNGSVLPRLMVTNCLNGTHKGRVAYNPSAISAWSNSGSGDNGGGSGSGRIPGSYAGFGEGWEGPAGPSPGDMSVQCHENQTGSGTDQSWNVKTLWAVYPVIAITTSPSADTFAASGSNVRATVRWATNIQTTSRVDYGPTASYGLTQTDPSPVVNNAVVLQNLTNHAAYHFRVTSVSPGDSQQISSGDNSFYVSVPPTSPVAVTQGAFVCASDCSVPLQWNASTDPDGGPIQYRVQVSTQSWFATTVYDSGWISGTSVTATGLATNANYYWRVQARDGDHTTDQDPPSAWSVKYLQLDDDRPTIYPWSIAADTFTSSGTDVMATVSWQTNKLGTSWVDYGVSATPYSTTTGTDIPPVYSHTVVLHNVANHATNHYRVRSAGGSLNAEAASADYTFFINLPPTVPVPVAQPNSQCTGSCPVTLQWNASTDPDGGPIEYDVQVGQDPSFGSILYDSGWTAGTTVTTSDLPTNRTYSWRVQARDAAATSAASAWSSPAGVFTLEDVPSITSGPSAGVFAATTGTNGTASITWTTDIPSSSCVDYGPTVSYGSTNCGASGSTGHSVQITGLSNHASYHYRVRSTGSFGNEMVSADYDFPFTVPPTVPVLIDQPASVCASACEVTVQWNASADPDNGPVSYNAQASTDSTFVTVNSSTSGLAAASWTVSLPTGTTWFWRVQAYDAGHPEAQSAWSSADSFDLSAPGVPLAPALSWPLNGYWGQVGYPAGENPLQWHASLGAAEYYAEYWGYSSGNSGWTAATSFNPGDLGDNNTYSWRVKARNAFGESPWSATWSWFDYWEKDSCPYIYIWDGEKYAYLTDLQNGPIGYRAGSFQSTYAAYHQPLYIVLDGLKPDGDGRHSIKLRETLAEISYIDEATLLAADVPVGYEFVSSTAEATYRYQYVNPLKLFTLRNARPPLTAMDHKGADVRAAALETDGNLLPHEIAALDYYTFDFGPLDPANAKLVIDGWSVYGAPYATALEKVQGSVEVVDANGQWVKVKSIGEPSGDMKRMVIDLSGLFKSNDRRVRLHTGRYSRVSWRIDKVMIDDSPPVAFATSEVPADAADLHYRGKATYEPSTFEHRVTAEDDALPVDPKAYGYGAFTKYGDVKALLTSTDDKYAIMRHGDEITLTFSALSAPVPEGMKRMYILKTDVYYKVFNVDKQVEPLPFHGMRAYPYDPAVEHYPDDPEHEQYRAQYNTRVVMP